ncbi:MAG: hypothetical protein ABSA05_14240 [Opitutaceae bacterium]|jgi:hypothetical protein
MELADQYPLLAVLVWGLFLAALLLKTYANRVRFLARHEMPQAFSRSPSFVTKFYFSRITLFWVAIAGIFFVYNIKTQLFAVGFYIIACAISFSRGSRKSINKWKRVNFEAQEQQAREQGVTFERDVALFKAEKTAEKMVENIMVENGKL